DQSAKSAQFSRELTRQYVTLVYPDIIGTDAPRQKAALSLLQIVEPRVALPLITWAQETHVILPGNVAEGNAVKKRLEYLENNRFRIFLHVGKAGNRPVPDIEV